MIQHFLIREGRSRLTILFAGWGMDYRPFEVYAPRQSDFMVCYDYSDMRFDAEKTDAYRSVHIVGWSMGVWAAGCVAKRITVEKTGTAINGTPWPIDERRGISPAVFYGTLRTLSAASLQKFRRRMCASAESLERFMSTEPARDVEDLRAELAAIAASVPQMTSTYDFWQEAYIGGKDLIFSAENQKQAWQQIRIKYKEADEAHYSENIFREVLR